MTVVTVEGHSSCRDAGSIAYDCSPNRSTERSDVSPTDEQGHVLHPQSGLAAGGDEMEITRFSNTRATAAEEENSLWRDLGVDINISLREVHQTTADQVHSTSSADNADDEDNDSDGPLIPRRRLHSRPSARSPAWPRLPS